jgi:peptidyl-prolyl cis-trans isomerase C
MVYAKEIRMMLQLKNIIRQPLLHFLLIGGFLFALYYVVNPGSNAKDTIVIDDEQVNRMVNVFEKEWNRPPSEEEMKGLLERYIQQEVYYRKALLMNLDHNDEIIRRRLDQKLKFITNDMATLKEPKEGELMSYYQANKTKYLLPKKYTFSHIYFSPDKRQNAKQDAAKTLETLPESDFDLNSIINKGDAFPFSYHLDSLSEQEIAQQMGDDFAKGLQNSPIKKWYGPVSSGYGIHLFFIDAIRNSVEPDLAQVRETVLRDYQYNLQQQYNTQLLDEFKKDFNIKLDIKDPNQHKQLSQLITLNAKQ